MYKTNLRKMISLLLIIILGIMATPAIFAASSAVSVSVNGDIVSFDQPPIIVNDRVLVPMRGVFEKLGATVSWNGNTQTATAKLGSVEVKITIDKEYMLYSDSSRSIKDSRRNLDVPAQILSDRTMIPIRAISEAFGCSVNWDGTKQRVVITNGISVHRSLTTPTPRPTPEQYNQSTDNRLADVQRQARQQAQSEMAARGMTSTSYAQQYIQAAVDEATDDYLSSKSSSSGSSVNYSNKMGRVTVTSKSFPFFLNSYDGHEYLGKLITSTTDSMSIFNKNGSYGSGSSSTSIFNATGIYGSDTSSKSAFCRSASSPPKILDSDGTVVAYLTLNTSIPNPVTIEELLQFLVDNRQ